MNWKLDGNKLYISIQIESIQGFDRRDRFHTRWLLKYTLELVGKASSIERKVLSTQQEIFWINDSFGHCWDDTSVLLCSYCHEWFMSVFSIRILMLEKVQTFNLILQTEFEWNFWVFWIVVYVITHRWVYESLNRHTKKICEMYVYLQFLPEFHCQMYCKQVTQTTNKIRFFQLISSFDIEISVDFIRELIFFRSSTCCRFHRTSKM